MMKSVSMESLFIPEPMSPYRVLMIKGCPLGDSLAKRMKTNFKQAGSDAENRYGKRDMRQEKAVKRRKSDF